jgi:hypothetical protein
LAVDREEEPQKHSGHEGVQRKGRLGIVNKEVNSEWRVISGE